MTVDVEKARIDTPGCFASIYFHHSGSSLMPDPVIHAITEHLEMELMWGGYEAEEEARPKLQSTYKALAEMLNCETREIALTESATASWNAAFYGIAQTFKQGDKILTAKSEYVSNMIAYLQVAQKTGVEVLIVPDDEDGQLDVKALEAMVDLDVKLISVTHVPTHNGLVNPINEIGQIANDYNIPYLVDACQSVGQMPVDVDQIGCEALSATGRKFLRGPRGSGFLVVRESSLDKFPPPVLDLHSATWTGLKSFELQPGARRYESFESSIALQIGLGVAVNYALSWGLTDIYSRVRFLADKLRYYLSQLEGVVLHDKGKEKCGIVTFSMAGVDAVDFQRIMRRKNIKCGVSKKSCALIDLGDWNVESIIRSPVHYYNTEEELKFFIKQIKLLIQKH